MSEIKNYTMNFSYGRPAGLTCLRTLAFTEIPGKRTLNVCEIG